MRAAREEDNIRIAMQPTVTVVNGTGNIPFGVAMCGKERIETAVQDKRTVIVSAQMTRSRRARCSGTQNFSNIGERIESCFSHE